eukprot:jgi/Psemu1/27991/gm1.27991_g
MSSIPIAGRTQSRSLGLQTLQPGSAATTSLLPTTNMAPNQQDNPTQDDEEDASIPDLFPLFDRPLATFLRDSSNVPKESNSILCEALINSQYKTWLDFLFIENIGDLTYLERGTRTPLSRHVQLNLQRVIDFGRHLTEQGLDWEDQDHYTKKAFKDYCRGIVKARRDSAADGGSRDETTFPVLQNDARFEHWLVKFKAKLETLDIDTHTFLDPNWPDIPLTGYTKPPLQVSFLVAPPLRAAPWTVPRPSVPSLWIRGCTRYHKPCNPQPALWTSSYKLKTTAVFNESPALPIAITHPYFPFRVHHPHKGPSPPI